MAYQRTEYADKTLSMNSLAQRKLKIQLDSLDGAKGTIEKEMNRERKLLRKELAAAEQSMKQRLSLSEQSAAPEPGKRLSPRLPRRYSTPQVLLTASLPARVLNTEKEKWPLAGNRARIESDGSLESAVKTLDSPTLSPASSQYLTAPLNQPRRRSLPPIGSGTLTGGDNVSGRLPTLPGKDGDGRRSRGSLSPAASSATLQRRRSGSPAAAEGGALSVDVAVKVSQFLQKIGQGRDKDGSKQDASDKQKYEDDFSSDDDDTLIHPLTVEPVKRPSVFQPSHFE